MGNPVALDASAELRDTRGFISTITMRPVLGSMANCTLEPPVSTPISRRQASARVAHHLIFAVGQRLRGGDGDGIAGVDAHGVEVFDGAHDDGVVRLIAHHFELEFLPAEDAFFDQDFMDRREVDAALQNFFGFFAVIGDAAAGAAHGEAGAQDHGVADARGEFQTFVDRIHQLRLRQFEADLLHGVLEEQPVFRFLDGIDFGADQFDAVFIEHAGFG